MATRKANGDGTLRQRPDGRWEFRAVVGTGLDGKLIRKSFYGAKQSEAKRKYKEFLQNKPTAIEKVKTVGEWAGYWLEIYKKGHVSENTYGQYERILKGYIVPSIGQLALTDVRPAHIQVMMNKYEHMSLSHLKKLKMTTSAIFESAIENDFLTRNPCRKIKTSSKADPPKGEHFSDDELRSILRACENTPGMASLGIYILLHTGIRTQELLGLMWHDIDFEQKVIQVRRTVVKERGVKKIQTSMKSETSRRDVPLLPQLEERLRREKKTSLYVVHEMRGNYYSPSGFKKTYDNFFVAALDGTVRHLSPHKCRHTFATQLLKKGVSIKVAQALLGHSDISTTGNIYTHADMSALKNALAGFKY